jgi:hypothetical protein
LGAVDEPDQELTRNGQDSKWGVGVNFQYERIREDTDGDGLSDKWETINHRDPNDGKLLFTFDCGGWQTEGWQADGEVTNIAGYQGFLDFDLLSGHAVLVRQGLKLDADRNQGSLVIRMRSNAKTRMTVSANGNLVGKVVIDSGAKYSEYKIPLSGSSWNGTITSLQLDYSSKPGTTVAIDWIRIDD